MKHQIVDLTALLDVILIILFAVLLNMNQSAETASALSSDQAEELILLKEEISDLEAALMDSNASNESLLEDIMSVRSQLNALENETSLQEQIHDDVIKQYKKLFENLGDVLATESETILDIADAQNMSDGDQQALLNDITDTNVLMENLHKYETIANTFAFIDITFDLEEGTLIYEGIPSNIYITEEDGLSDHLFQIKRDEIVDYLSTTIEQEDIKQSFILITIKFDPYTTRRYYISMVTEAIDQLRETYQEKVIFDTIYLTE